jgi:hydrogenase maturation protein HypF
MTRQSGLQIQVRGIVQGVGFRPFIYNLATRLDLTGWVRNTSSGVEIEVSGTQEALQSFISTIRNSPPPLARIDTIDSQPCDPFPATGFEIQTSLPQPGEFIPVSPDVAICADCQRELFDPHDRRYRYPFINCTNCGPRYTIVRDIPYDRPNTTMADFRLCPDCQSEYDDPQDRRFHAQPVACPECGPQLSFEAGGQVLAREEDALQMARTWLKQGKILAVKGLGGYHLACDAMDPRAVDELRRRKKRSDKPFALMAPDLATLKKYCLVTQAEEEMLTSRQKPIVILERRPDSTIAEGVAPNQHTLGVMLPYTPEHLLLLEPEEGFPEMLVMTSGNLSEEPIAYLDEDALERLAPLADGFLLHDRPIHIRVDDSVARIAADGSYFVRRSRGYAPDPIRLPFTLPPVLAVGAELKNSFCLTRERYAFLSHFIGDMENYETLRSFEEGIAHLERLFRIQPETLTCDLHPDYLASHYAQERASRENLPLIQVQHHHAHLAACLAENNWTDETPVIGLSFDGTGLGTDGAIWGGEVLLGGYAGYQRRYHLQYVPLPGGDLAVRKPSRMALAHLWQAGLAWDDDLPPLIALSGQERAGLRAQIDQRLNCPPTSSMGRLFDAVSALIGVRQTATYEGQAAIELEALADQDEGDAYEFDVRDGIIRTEPMLSALLHDWRAGVKTPVLSARFHNGVVQLADQLSRELRRREGAHTVALSGGVWQNIYLLERTMKTLTASGFSVLVHRQLPPNDGCIALGQAAVAASAINDGKIARN